MTVAQAIFALALSAVVLGVLAFGVAVIRSAARTDGGAYPAHVAGRLLRAPADRVEANRWAFYAHRITGIAVLAFLCLHVLDVATWTFSRDVFDQLHEVYGSAPLRLLECGLLLAILFHTLNGLRIVAIDVADLGAAAARRLLGGVLALTVLLGAAGSVVMLAPLVS
jgi:succinate dehydrogenase / fumarate reductase cytochrome b subunit